MTHKDNEWFLGRPEVAGRYYWGGAGETVNLEWANSYATFIIKTIPCVYEVGWWVRVGDVDPIPPVPVARPEKVDTPVEVKDSDSDKWQRAYLAGWDVGGWIECFVSGQTKWSSGGLTTYWQQWRLPEEE